MDTFEERQPFSTALDLTSSHPADFWVQKGKWEQICQHFKKPHCHFYPATSSSFCENSLEGYPIVNKTHVFSQLASGARVRTTKLVCISESQEELSHLTSRTFQPIHFHSVTLY